MQYSFESSVSFVVQHAAVLQEATVNQKVSPSQPQPLLLICLTPNQSAVMHSDSLLQSSKTLQLISCEMGSTL